MPLAYSAFHNCSARARGFGFASRRRAEIQRSTRWRRVIRYGKTSCLARSAALHPRFPVGWFSWRRIALGAMDPFGMPFAEMPDRCPSATDASQNPFFQKFSGVSAKGLPFKNAESFGSPEMTQTERSSSIAAR